MINLLREINNKKLAEALEKNLIDKAKEQKIIQEILKDDLCFEKLPFVKGKHILKTLDVKDWKEVYALLLSK